MLQQNLNVILLLFTVIFYSSENEILPHSTTLVGAFLSSPVTLNCSYSNLTVNWVSSNNEYLFSYFECENTYPHIPRKPFEGVKSNCSRATKSTFLNIPSISKEHDKLLIKCERKDEQDIIFMIKIINDSIIQVNSVHVKVGQSATLHCIITHFEKFKVLSIKWTQEIYGQQIEGHVSNGRKLIFNNVSWSDTGNWTCAAMIKGYHITHMIKGSGKLSATGVPIVDHLKNVTAELLQSKTIKAFIYSYLQRITIVWYHNNSTIVDSILISPTNRQTSLENHTIHLPGYVTQLKLDDIKQNDSGYYTLSVKSNDGVSNVTFILRIKSSEKEASPVVFIVVGTIVITILLTTFFIIIVCRFCIKKKPSESAVANFTRKLPEVPLPTSTSIENSWNEKVLSDTKSLGVQYYNEFDDDTHSSEKDEPIYAEIGYIDMTTARHLKCTKNEYLNPRSVMSKSYVPK